MSRHKCNKDLYKAFLQATSVRYSGLALSDVAPSKLSHDSISRWLKDKRFQPKEIWTMVKNMIPLDKECILIADDSVLSKNYSKKIDIVQYQYSGHAHDVIAGIGLINLLWYDLHTGESMPVDYRIYNKESDGKTKNTNFCDMLSLAKKRGLSPSAVVMDAWYSSLKNLKSIRDHGWIWVTTLRKNRKVNKNITLENLEIPEEGLKVHLRGYGWVKVFKFVAKNGRIDFIATNKEDPTRNWIVKITKARWSIEVYHRELKQTCGIERCQARSGRSQRNHICLSILTWIDKHRRRIHEKLTFYQQDWNGIKDGISNSIQMILSIA